MYKKAVSLLLLGQMIFAAGLFCVKGMTEIRIAVQPVSQLRLEVRDRGADLQGDSEDASLKGGIASAKGLGIADAAASDQRVLDCAVVEQQPAYDLSDEEKEALLRIVEAEAGSEDEDGRLLVANVVLNRVRSERFPDTVTDVVFQKLGDVAQFSPVSSGRFYRVKISDETVSAVGRALTGEDISQGALFFASRKHAGSDKMKWFENKLTFLFEHGGHEFYK